MSQQSLATLVAIYRRKHGLRIAADLEYFAKLESLDDAIRFACHGKDGKIHGHQRRVGKVKLEQARKVLQLHTDEITACKLFDELLAVVEDCTSSINRFGVMAVYDTSLRLGAHLDLWPEVVYLHAGTKKGCKALGVPAQLKSLSPIRWEGPIYQTPGQVAILDSAMACKTIRHGRNPGALYTPPLDCCRLLIQSQVVAVVSTHAGRRLPHPRRKRCGKH